jgi:hypothetical protein
MIILHFKINNFLLYLTVLMNSSNCRIILEIISFLYKVISIITLTIIYLMIHYLFHLHFTIHTIFIMIEIFIIIFDFSFYRIIKNFHIKIIFTDLNYINFIIILFKYQYLLN